MTTAAPTPKAIPLKPSPRKALLSPELREVLHMLKSLEAELDARQAKSL